MSAERRKVCARCALNLPEAEFSKRRDMRDGLDSRCKTCQSVRYRTRYESDPELWKRAQRRRYANDPAQCNERTVKALRERRAGRPAREPRYLAEIPQ